MSDKDDVGLDKAAGRCDVGWFSGSGRFGWLAVWVFAQGLCALDVMAQASAVQAAALGQELRLAEEVTRSTPAQMSDSSGAASGVTNAPTIVRSSGAITNGLVNLAAVTAGVSAASSSQGAGAASAAGALIRSVEFTGDTAFLSEEGGDVALRRMLVGMPLADVSVQSVLRAAESNLIYCGFHLAKFNLQKIEPSNGVVRVNFDAGRFGRHKLRMNLSTSTNTPPNWADYRGKYFSKEQIERKLVDIEEGKIYDYRSLYNTMFQINNHPDLKIDTVLRMRPDSPERVADLDLAVREKLPVHVIAEVENTGTKATGDWRGGLSLQHLNLTQHDDVLTVRGSSSIEDQSMVSGAGSYSIPHHLGDGGLGVLYGGWSQIDSREIFEGITIQGSGYFVGSQGSYNLLTGPRHSISVLLGLVYRYVDDRLLLEENPNKKRAVETLPLTLGFSYASARRDSTGGRNFLTSESVYNVGPLLDISKAEDFDQQRLDAETEYFIQRLQIARLQPFSPQSEWMAYAKADGQMASAALIPAEQKAIGGSSSVRGYLEREVIGDDGVTCSLEIRTPMYRNVLSKVGRGGGGDTIQFVTFVNAGYVTRQAVLQGEEDTRTLVGTGMGLRYSLGEHFQLRLDGAVPLETTEDSQDITYYTQIRAQF